MHDHAEPFRILIEAAWKFCSLLSGLVRSLILRHCKSPIGLSSGIPSKLVAERQHYRSVDMDEKDMIDISSSDSDSAWDLAYYRDLDESPSREATSSANPSSSWMATSGMSLKEQELLAQRHSANNPRILPSCASPSGTSLGGNHGLLQEVPYPRKPSASNGSLSNLIPSRTGDRVSSSNVGQDDRSKYSSGNDYVRHSSQQILKRTLPASLQPSVPSARSSSLVENVSSSQMREAYGTSSSIMAKPYLNNGRSPTKDLFIRGTDDEVVMYENSGSRILPPSLMHGKPYSRTQYANSTDPFYHPMVGEEKAAGTDERLIYQAALEDLNQPKIEVPFPDGLLSVSLLRHQKIALAWMLQKETRTLHCLGGFLADDQGLGKTISMIALILMQRSLQLKSKSKDICNSKTEALNLDDDDDNSSFTLDKANKQTGESDDVKLITEASNSVPEFRRRRPAAGTLVVCPASVLRQWARELDEKVADDAKLSVLVYHGGTRTKDPVELAKYDVVLTTYFIVANEVPKQPLVDEDDDDHKDGERYGLSSEFSTNKKRKKASGVGKKGKKSRKGIDSAFDCDCGTLAKVGWFRVVLDEAQTIKNHRTQVARACCGLRAKQRWCLSGTPIQNAIDELFSYFRFLRYDPYANYKSFCNTIKIPISRNSVHGYKKLQAVLRAIMLRRTKGTLIDGEPIVKLPPKTIRLTKVDFSAKERAFYNKLEADSRSQFKAYAAAGTVNQNYANILLMLLRLRQACDHPVLVKGFNADSIGKISSEMARKLPRNMIIKLSNLLEASLAICCLCSDPPEDAVVAICGHVFCYQCVSEYLTGDDNTCPMSGCKEQLGADVVFSKAMLRNCISDDHDGNVSSSYDVAGSFMDLQSEYCSSKIRAALDIIQSHGKSKNTSPEQLRLVHSNGNSFASEERHSDSLNEAPIKAIVFSQWTGMLDIVEIALEQSSIEYRRLDGTMTLAARDKAVKEFNADPEVTVMLMSLKAGNLGLNMVAACHVILLDLWWNPTTEDQAIDRAHRIGQTRPVTVSRLTIKDTVEDRILALQEEKRKMIASAFGEDHSGGSATRLTVEDLKYLFMV